MIRAMMVRGTLRCVMLACGVVAGGQQVRAAEPPAAPPPLGSEPASAAGEAAPPVATPEQAYLATLRAECARRWTNSFVVMAERQLPADHPVNDASRKVVLDVAIAADGAVKAVDVGTSSGAKELDASAVDVVKDIRRLAGAPDDAISDDGQVHVVWTFERAKGRCEDVAIIQKESPLEQAVPRLFAQGREAMAIARVTAALGNGAEPGVTVLARQWLASAAKDKTRASIAAAALARAGDKDARAQLQRQAGSSLDAASAFAAAGGDVCTAVLPYLAGKPADREAALRVLAQAAAASTGCADKIATIAEDEAQPVSVRAAALRALAATGSDAGRKVITAALEHQAPAMRAAAAVAVGRSGAGRPALFKLTPLIKDSSVEVRSAAGAAMVRAAGEPAIEQLYLLWKESDSRPYTELAPELGKLTSEASAEMLGKMLKRGAVEVRAAAAEALAGRRDAHARTALAAAAKDASPEVRVFATALLAPGERSAAAASAPTNGVRAYRAMLRAGDRDAAGGWLMAQLPALAPADRAARFGDWLAGAAGEPKVTARR